MENSKNYSDLTVIVDKTDSSSTVSVLSDDDFVIGRIVKNTLALQTDNQETEKNTDDARPEHARLCTGIHANSEAYFVC